MNIRIYSDLHLEFGNFVLRKLPDDHNSVLVLAGDIGVGTSARELVEGAAKRFKHVIYVAGNHEFYNRNHPVVIRKWREISDSIENFSFLENETVTIDGKKFIGATLWSDYNKENHVAMYAASYYMNDFRKIKYEGTGKSVAKPFRKLAPLTTERCLEMHRESLEFIKQEIEPGCIVVTHHSPTLKGLGERQYRRGDNLMYAYYTDLEYLMGNPMLWIFGHTHAPTNITIRNTDVISNPRGYVGYETPNNFDDRGVNYKC